MDNMTPNIHAWRSPRHWLRGTMTCLSEALLFAGSLHAACLATGVSCCHWYYWFALGIAGNVIAGTVIPNVTYRRTARRDQVTACAMQTALTILVLSMATLTAIGHPALGIRFWLGALGIFALALTIWRRILNGWFIRYCIKPGRCEQGILITDTDSAEWQDEALMQNTYGLKLTRLEPTEDVAAYLDEHAETTSAYCMPSAVPACQLEAIAQTCRAHGVVLHLLPQPVPALNMPLRSECRGGITVLSPARRPLRNLSCRILKRTTDIVLSLIILLTVFPLVAVIAAICIKRQSRGPVLSLQDMCGMDGKMFTCIRFRTRHTEAATVSPDGDETPTNFPFGRFLTRTRMELLPEFICVLRGTMTIVGSQLLQPEMLHGYRSAMKQGFASGYRLKAGITSHRMPGETEGSPKADAWYCRNWGFWLDVRIMLGRLAALIRQSKTKTINYL